MARPVVRIHPELSLGSGTFGSESASEGAGDGSTLGLHWVYAVPAQPRFGPLRRARKALQLLDDVRVGKEGHLRRMANCSASSEIDIPARICSEANECR